MPHYTNKPKQHKHAYGFLKKMKRKGKGKEKEKDFRNNTWKQVLTRKKEKERKKRKWKMVMMKGIYRHKHEIINMHVSLYSLSEYTYIYNNKRKSCRRTRRRSCSRSRKELEENKYYLVGFHVYPMIVTKHTHTT